MKKLNSIYCQKGVAFARSDACALLLFCVCWVSKHGNRHDLHVSAVSCVSWALPGPVPWFSRHSSGQHCNPVHSISVSLCPPAHVRPSLHACCVSICLLSLPVLHAPLGPVRIKGHFSKGQSSHFQRWKVTRAVSGVRWHWTSAQLKAWQVTPLGTWTTSLKGRQQYIQYKDVPCVFQSQEKNVFKGCFLQLLVTISQEFRGKNAWGQHTCLKKVVSYLNYLYIPSVSSKKWIFFHRHALISNRWNL